MEYISSLPADLALTDNLIKLIKKAWGILDNSHRGALDIQVKELPREAGQPTSFTHGILLRLDLPQIRLWVVPSVEWDIVSIRRELKDGCWSLVSSHIGIESAATEAVLLLIKELIKYELNS